MSSRVSLGLELSNSNSGNHRTWRQLGDIFNLISSDSRVRAVILSGAGDRAFTSGLDLSPETLALLSGTVKGEEPLEEERLRFYKHRVIKDFQV